MTEEQSGIYSCSAILPNERRTVIQTRVRLKPDIILSQGKAIASTEGKDVLLECLLGSDFVLSKFLSIFSDYFLSRKKLTQKKLRNFAKLQFLNDKIYS